MNSGQQVFSYKFYFARLKTISNTYSSRMWRVCSCNHTPFQFKACQGSCWSKHFTVCIAKTIPPTLPRQNVKSNNCLGNYLADAFLCEFQWLSPTQKEVPPSHNLRNFCDSKLSGFFVFFNNMAFYWVKKWHKIRKVGSELMR